MVQCWSNGIKFQTSISCHMCGFGSTWYRFIRKKIQLPNWKPVIYLLPVSLTFFPSIIFVLSGLRLSALFVLCCSLHRMYAPLQGAPQPSWSNILRQKRCQWPRICDSFVAAHELLAGQLACQLVCLPASLHLCLLASLLACFHALPSCIANKNSTWPSNLLFPPSLPLSLSPSIHPSLLPFPPSLLPSLPPSLSPSFPPSSPLLHPFSLLPRPSPLPLSSLVPPSRLPLPPSRLHPSLLLPYLTIALHSRWLRQSQRI